MKPDRQHAGLFLQPTKYGDAAAFVAAFHRHHPRAPNSRAFKFAIAVATDAGVVGVIMCGRPVARHLDDGWTLEVHPCCTDGEPNAASMLYAAAWRAARALGYHRLITYTLQTERGTSLVAAGYRVVGQTRAQSWNRPSRPRTDRTPPSPKTLWEIAS
jgi:hypothetical protein